MIIITVYVLICRVTETIVARLLSYMFLFFFSFFFSFSIFFPFFSSHYSASHCMYDVQNYGGKNPLNAGWLFCTVQKQKDIRAKALAQGMSSKRGARKPQDGEKIRTKANNKINVKNVHLYYGHTKK